MNLPFSETIKHKHLKPRHGLSRYAQIDEKMLSIENRFANKTFDKKVHNQYEI